LPPDPDPEVAAYLRVLSRVKPTLRADTISDLCAQLDRIFDTLLKDITVATWEKNASKIHSVSLELVELDKMRGLLCRR